jgi:hypothetical protein
MKKIVFVLLVAITLTFNTPPQAAAQCAMCTVSAEQSVKNGNTQGNGLNSGILYLLAIPYILITGIGILWYVKYRKRTTQHHLS